MHTPEDEPRRAAIRAARNAWSAEQARQDAADDAAQARIVREQRALAAERPATGGEA